jgi:hypothetical protein
MDSSESSLTWLAINCLDEMNRLRGFQKLLKIAADRQPKEMDLLLESYLLLSEPHLEKLDSLLEQIMCTIGKD